MNPPWFCQVILIVSAVIVNVLAFLC
eukprot:SAG31_NODE_19777_length_591_cov_8.160569_1_plen_25_part_10